MKILFDEKCKPPKEKKFRNPRNNGCETVQPIEKSLTDKESALEAFLDIVGASNEVNTEAMNKTLQELGVDTVIINWVIRILDTKFIGLKVGDVQPKRRQPEVPQYCRWSLWTRN